ncbi:Maf-like protein [Bacteroides sp. 51]|uniref:Maf-like protein n=1 Tax=Bacteroides sp. 51 TaxID=2302938 RepID=UPI0013D7BCA0|nr:Maf-like protein [Bacteroides sp. 51]NDV84294.1 septum formation protein Maf [Bacteroides sp. 51]
MNKVQHPLAALLGTEGYKVVLASASPRRQELLTGLGIDFEVRLMPDLDESYPSGLDGEKIPSYIARHKAEAYKSTIQPKELLITADTIVWLNGEVLGKPVDEEDAKAILRRLSGKTHHVITGVCLTTTDWQKSFTAVTDVSFSDLTEEEIEYYIANYHPLDKAGAYGVQEWIGYVGVEGIHGSYFNVMGLPIQKLYKELMRLL